MVFYWRTFWSFILFFRKEIQNMKDGEAGYNGMLFCFAVDCPFGIMGNGLNHTPTFLSWVT
jgi:hypothetical protein